MLWLVFGARAVAATPQPPPGWQPAGTNSWVGDQPKYVVLLILDGGLPSYLKLGNFPHLAALVRNGTQYSRAWAGILESETPSGHATIGTGSLPRRHGVLSFGWVDGSGAVEYPTDPASIQHGDLEWYLWKSGVPSLASALKQHDPKARVLVTSGHKDYAVDSVGGWAADYLMYYAPQGNNWVPQAIPRHVPPQSVMTAPGLSVYGPHMGPGDQDSLAVQLAMSGFSSLHQRVTIINLPEFDWPLGHLLGGAADHDYAWQLTNRLDADLASIEWEYWKAGVLKKTLFVLTADHGMATLNHTVSYQSIENAVKAAGTSLIRYDFHTAGYLWLRDASKAQAVADRITSMGNPLIRSVYYRKPGTSTYIAASGASRRVAGADEAYRYLLSTMAGPTSPQVAVFLAENTSILGREQVGWHGDHGGASWNVQHVPLVLSGPGVRRGLLSSYPATLADIAPTILTLLGASPSGMDGVPLTDAFLQPSNGDVTVQQQRGQQLRPIVESLMAQSRKDGS